MPLFLPRFWTTGVIALFLLASCTVPYVCAELPVHEPLQVSLNTPHPSNVSETLPRLSVRRTEETNDASLYIDLNEVLRFRHSAGGMTPVERANAVRSRLAIFLEQGGNPRDIKPGLEGASVVIRAGETALVTIDTKTADKSGLTTKQLAFQWTNLIRKALGAELLVRTPELAASRGFSPALGQMRQVSTTGAFLKGMASWYGPGFHGRRAASGERFNMHDMTAAHRTLPFQTRVKVTNMWTGQSALVRITDRGPYVHGRVIDLSKSAAGAIGMLSSGTAPVVLEILGR
jgi:rare lipoprotein A